ncbi:MAG: RNA methyltransferase [Phycisphaeraceae bacterium]|nr:RNA methyltransferase [Phycisphaeraceae bacterium]
MPIVTITSLDDPRIADYRSLRDQELAQRADPASPAAHRGIFMAEGELVVRRLAESPFAVRSLLLAESRVEPMRDLLDALASDVPAFVAPQRVVNEIIGFNIHRGVLAVGERGEPAEIGALLARRGPFVVLEDLCNHDNIGAIFRNCAALGGAGVSVLLSPRTADPLYRKSLRVSMGHALLVPWARLDRWPDALHEFRAAGIRVLALTPGAGAHDVREIAAELRAVPAAPAPRIALLLGTEGDGLSAAAMAHADQLVRIDMPPGPTGAVADSLNVAVAAAVALHALACATEPPPRGRGQGEGDRSTPL